MLRFLHTETTKKILKLVFTGMYYFENLKMIP